MLFFKYNKEITNFDLINKFSYCNITNIPFLERIILNVNISNSDSETFSGFSRSLFLLELISGQKAIVAKYATSAHGRGQKRIVFHSSVILRKKFLFNFLYLFHNFVFLNLTKKFLSINKRIGKANYSFTIKDITIFPGTSEVFIKWIYPLHVSLLPKTSDLNLTEFELILRNLNFIIITKI